MDTLPHLSGQPGNDKGGLEEAPSGMITAGRKMHSMSTRTFGPRMVGCNAISCFCSHFNLNASSMLESLINR
jgi:hypothetical protein